MNSKQKSTSAARSIGDNVVARLDGTHLILTIDTSASVGPSASGKSLGIATTRGNRSISLSDGRVVHLGLNLYERRDERRDEAPQRARGKAALPSRYSFAAQREDLADLGDDE
jgi:hypothetical protein